MCAGQPEQPVLYNFSITNIIGQVFTGVVAVTDNKFCIWDPRKPLAHPNSLLEIVDGCGYPQPTRVSTIKLIYVPGISFTTAVSSPNVPLYQLREMYCSRIKS